MPARAEVARNCTQRLRDEKRAAVAAYKSAQGCRECGEPDAVVLDCHHRDPDEKHERLRGPNKRLIQLGWSELMAELEKCDVLCANCHRREHASES